MNRYEAQYQFWASFGFPVYEANHRIKEDERRYPYITYEAVSAPFDNNQVINVNIWTRSESYAQVNAIAENIQRRFENERTIIRYNGNRYIWYTAEPNFIQTFGDPDDDAVKRIVITLTLHW